MTLNENVSKAYSLREQKKALEAQIEELSVQVKNIEDQLKPIDAELLKSIKKEKKDELEFDGLFLNLFCKTSNGYTNESDVIKYLKSNNLNDCVSVKESIAKKELNKKLKADADLKNALSKYIIESKTEYITVTDKENHDKMLEHIKDNYKESAKDVKF